MAKAKITNFDENDIRRLERVAMGGDESAYKELLKLNATYAKRANTRLSALEANKYDYYAYDRASSYAKITYDKARFTTSKKALNDAHGVAQNLREIRQFLESKSSTISGQKGIEQTRIKAFKAKGFEIPEDKEKEFLKFLGSEDVRNAIEVIGRSEDIIDAIRGEVEKENGKTIKQMKRQFKAFSDGKIAYDELMDRITT